MIHNFEWIKASEQFGKSKTAQTKIWWNFILIIEQIRFSCTVPCNPRNKRNNERKNTIFLNQKKNCRVFFSFHFIVSVTQFECFDWCVNDLLNTAKILAKPFFFWQMKKKLETCETTEKYQFDKQIHDFFPSFNWIWCVCVNIPLVTTLAQW